MDFLNSFILILMCTTTSVSAIRWQDPSADKGEAPNIFRGSEKFVYLFSSGSLGDV